jgi:hypothetical protein
MKIERSNLLFSRGGVSNNTSFQRIIRMKKSISNMKENRKQIHIGDVFSNSVQKISTSAGKSILLLFIGVNLFLQFITSTLSFGISGSVLIILINLLLTVIVSIGAIRHFAQSADDLENLKWDKFSKNVVGTAIQYLIGTFIISVAIVILLITPIIGILYSVFQFSLTASSGILLFSFSFLGLLIGFMLSVFLSVSFYFFPPVVVLEDKNFVQSLQKSRDMSRGQRIKIFAIIAIITIISFSFGGFSSINLGFLDIIINSISSGIIGAYTIGVTTEAYIQVAE